MPPHFVNCAHFCGGSPQHEHAVETLMMRFYRDHQVAHEYSNRAASQLQNAFIADRDGDVAAALSYFGDARKFMEDTVRQWDLVKASNQSLTAFLPGRLRPEFVKAMAGAGKSEFLQSLQKIGNSPAGLNHPFEEVAGILSAGNEASVVQLFQTNGSKIDELKSLNEAVLAVLVGLQPLVQVGRLWDEVVPYSFLVEKRKHELIDLDEKYFAALMSHAFYLEAISQLSREALINSEIPYEECQSRNKKK